MGVRPCVPRDACFLCEGLLGVVGSGGAGEAARAEKVAGALVIESFLDNLDMGDKSPSTRFFFVDRFLVAGTGVESSQTADADRSGIAPSTDALLRLVRFSGEFFRSLLARGVAPSNI